MQCMCCVCVCVWMACSGGGGSARQGSKQLGPKHPPSSIPPTARSRPRPLQIVLLGVCCSAGPGGSGDECEELSLQPLPLYSVPADGVTMVTVAPTADGRIFLGGAGGWVAGWGVVVWDVCGWLLPAEVGCD